MLYGQQKSIETHFLFICIASNDRTHWCEATGRTLTDLSYINIMDQMSDQINKELLTESDFSQVSFYTI